MAIEIELNQDTAHYYPVVRCDFTGEIIPTADMGAYYWQVDREGTPATPQVWFIKKGWQHAFEAATPTLHGTKWYWLELTEMWDNLFERAPFSEEVLRWRSD